MPPRVLYRLVYHDPLTREDFLSDEERGAPAAPHETPEDRSGMSVWGKLREARGWAKRQVRTGKRSYVGIAEVIVEETGPFREPGNRIGKLEQAAPAPHNGYVFVIGEMPNDGLLAEARLGLVGCVFVDGQPVRAGAGSASAVQPSDHTEDRR